MSTRKRKGRETDEKEAVEQGKEHGAKEGKGEGEVERPKKSQKRISNSASLKEEEDKATTTTKDQKPSHNDKKSKKSPPSTLKEKILFVLSQQESLIGLATLKKLLEENYEIEANNKANNSHLLKTLKELGNEAEKGERDDFGKGEIQCPYCQTWKNADSDDNDDDSWEREEDWEKGKRYFCGTCSQVFYSWLSDCDRNLVGHKTKENRKWI